VSRNPGWERQFTDVDPFTGLVLGGSLQHRGYVGPAATMSDSEYAARRRAPIALNADLIGLSPTELASIVWTPGSFVGNTWDLAGGTASGSIECPGPVNPLLRSQPCWSLHVSFHRDGVVTGFNVRHNGLPSGLCTTPAISAEQARRAKGLFDASKQEILFGSFKGIAVKPDQVGAARLAVASYLEGQPTTRAKSSTARLVWDVYAGGWSFSVDAVSGKVVGVGRNWVNESTQVPPALLSED
jgi:hypothetical protein